jgi:hypothetical protein
MRTLFGWVSAALVAMAALDIAERLRALDLRHVVFGSDRSGAQNEAPGVAWASFRRRPLTEAEFALVATNVLY